MPESSKTRLGNYELLEVLGDGAEGTVHKARCISDKIPGINAGDLVAVKSLKDTRFKSFQQQVEILRKLNHPNIVRYLDSFVFHRDDLDEEGYCIVTELLEGHTLKERMELAQHKSGLPWAAAQKIMTGILDALVFSSSLGVVHRDLKSSNIYVTNDDEGKLIDFGIARAEDSGASTVAGGFKGTFDYMAPDFVTFQAESGFHGDAQSDVFSFGVIFYEVLTGGLPWEKLKGSNLSIEYVTRWLRNPPKVKYERHSVFEVMHGTRSCLRKCLDPNRSARYQTFAQLQVDFKEIRPRQLTVGDIEYEYITYLGKGGFGKVFHARRVSDGVNVAIKELLSPDRQTRRFEKEAEILKAFPHPHLTAYLDFIEIKEQGLGNNRRFFLILEYLKGMPGSSLRDRIKASQGGMDPAEAIPIFIHYLDCLNFLHRQGIIHRDIKPANLYAPEDEPENAKIFDLGIAHDSEGTLTHGQVPGTLDYMPPEFATQEGGRGSSQSDIYALGVTFFQAMTGQMPFERFPSEEGAAWAAFYLRAEKPLACEFDHPIFTKYPALKNVAGRCLAHNAKDRYESAEAMAKDLDLILKEVPQPRLLEHDGETYKFGHCLAAGTYKARRKSDGASVIIKEFTADGSQIDRLDTEAHILVDFPHPHCVKYIAFVEGEQEGDQDVFRCFLILEFLDSLHAFSLRERIRASESGLNAEEILAIFDLYLSCLDHLHHKRIFHGDIRPDHLYAPADTVDKCKMFDLGLALGAKEKTTAQGKPGGLAYWAPELLATGARSSHQSDIYALGVSLYEALTGKLPFPNSAERPPLKEEWNQISFEHSVFKSERGRKLAEVLRRAMAFEVQGRFASASEMRSALAQLPHPPEAADGEATLESFRPRVSSSSPLLAPPPTLPPSKPGLMLALLEAQPKGPVRAGRKQVWKIGISAVGGARKDKLTVSAVSRAANLVPNDSLAAKIEDGKAVVTAHSLKTVSGKAKIEVSVSSGTVTGKIELTMDIEAIPPPRVKLLTPLPLCLSAKDKSLQLDFTLADEEVSAESLSFFLKVTPPHLVKFDPPPQSGGPSRSLRLLRSPPHNGRGDIDVTVEADGRSTTTRFDLEVMQPARPAWLIPVASAVLIVIGLAIFLFTRKSAPPSTVQQQPAQPVVSQPATHLALLTPNSLLLPAHQDSVEVKFSLSDDDAKAQAHLDSLKFQVTSSDPGILTCDQPVANGAERSVKIARGKGYGPVAVNIRVEGGSRSLNTNLNFQVEANPGEIWVSSEPVVLASNQKETVIRLGVSDPYQTPEALQPKVKADPDNLEGVAVQAEGTNWAIHLKRKGKMNKDCSGTLIVTLPFSSGPITTNLPFTCQAVPTTPQPALSLANAKEADMVVDHIFKLNDAPLKIACLINGSNLQVAPPRVTSDSAGLLPEGHYRFQAPQNPEENGSIILSPAPGVKGDAVVEFDASADGAVKTHLSLHLTVRGDFQAPILVVETNFVALDPGGVRKFEVGIDSAYFPADRLSVKSQVDPPSLVELQSLPGPLKSTFVLGLIGKERGAGTIKITLTEPNSESVTKTIDARVLQPFSISGPASVNLSTEPKSIPLVFSDESEALDAFSTHLPQVDSAKKILTSANWSLSSMMRQPSNGLINLTLNSPAQPGSDVVKVTATDLWQRTATYSISVSFEPPFRSSLGLSFVWMAGLPDTADAVWKVGNASLSGGGWVAEYKVSRELFQQVMHQDPSYFPNKNSTKNLPVENMTFKQARDFCDQLTKLDKQAGLLPEGWSYALPSLDQWVFYAKGTPATADYAYFREKDVQPYPLGQKSANSHGLYDVLGDVFELTRTSVKSDQGVGSHIRRGGWCQSTLPHLSTDPSDPNEYFLYPDDLDNPNYGKQTGFRVILVPQSAAN